MNRIAALTLLLAGSTVFGLRAQPVEVVLFDESDPAGADYREASMGLAVDGDYLLLRGPSGNRMPIAVDRAYSGATSGLLEWEHVVGGRWEVNVEPGGNERFDLAGFDSLIVWLNGPTSIPGAELPRIGLRDIGGMPTPLAWLSTPEDVRIDDRETGFAGGSATNVRLSSRYIAVVPRTERRIGYPEDLVVTFASEPLDTSVAAIGAPATPAHFRVSTADTGLQVDFRFRDVDGDHTLGASGEYVDILLPRVGSAHDPTPTWRIQFEQAPDPVVPPTEGDVFELRLQWSEFSLDAEPETWQRVAIPIGTLLATEDFTDSAVWLPFLANGGVTSGRRTLWFDRITAVDNDDETFLDEIQSATFRFFWNEANPANGLIKDRSRPSSQVASIASVGFGLSAYTVGIDRGWITRDQGRERTLNTLRFFWEAPQGTSVDGMTGYRGFFYHFLHMDTGRRTWNSELSTIDTALLLGGVLHVREYFDGDDADEIAIRTLADSIYRRVDWVWAQNNPPAISLSWRPETGFNTFDWRGYNEAMILYILALGSPTHPVEPAAWDAWTSGYSGDWRTEYGYTFLTFPPLFGHQYSHVWIDFRGIRDAYMRSKGIDYFENSRRATLAQRAYHIANPAGWPNYGPDEWGITASDTPTGYRARGAPPVQNDDGTLVPTAPGGSIVFTPEESIASLRTMRRAYPRLWGPYGFRDAYNVAAGWFDEDYIGIDQGPILLMAENHRSERVWDVFMRNPDIRRGLIRAGFDNVPSALESEPLPEELRPVVFPNPFGDRTRIRYHVGAAGRVRVVVYDLLGREVATLADAMMPSGTYTAVFEADGFAPGLYLARLTSAGQSSTARLLLAR